MSRRLAGWSRAARAVFLVCVGSWSVGISAAPTVWLAPVDDQVTPAGFRVDQDYPQLFQAGASWQKALSNISVFEMVRRYVTTESEPKLREMFTFLREHNIELAIGAGMVPARNCGVEGTAHRPDENVLTARRLKRLGADVKYIVMDEPMTWGHSFKGKNGCRYSIDELAAGVAGEIRKFREVFPDVQIIEDEAHAGVGPPAELGQWLDALRAQLGNGAPVSVRFDVQWASSDQPWRQFVKPLVRTVLDHGYHYGIIFDGTPLDSTDDGWIRTAQANIKAWESAIKDSPDHIVIQSWHRHPTSLLPETSPTTLTYLVNWFCDNSQLAAGCRSRQ